MNYDEIKALALSYSDRQDNEVIDRMDDFFRITEARMNRILKVQKQVIRTSILTVDDEEYYGLPVDFAGLRDIELYPVDAPENRTTLQYLSPEQMNNVSSNGDVAKIYYNIIANQLHVLPIKEDSQIEIAYYRNITPLKDNNPENWMSIDNPDTYLYGLMVEISSFVKSAEAKAIWDERFKESMVDINQEDGSIRWSGTALQTRLG